jgi:hypothetical protein
LQWLPSIDGQTAFSIAVGAVLTLATFWFAYRKTIGAKEERIRSANRELISSVIKRVAVERQPLTSEHYSRLRRAKGYDKSLNSSQLLTFPTVRDIVFSEIVESSFLDQVSKDEIIALLDQCDVNEFEVASSDQMSSHPW